MKNLISFDTCALAMICNTGFVQSVNVMDHEL